MNQLALINGDLFVGTDGGYLLVSGVDRIRQDLTLALREQYGTDRFHPGWGSIVMGYLGTVLTSQTQALVRAEVNRILQNYLILQQNQVLRGTLYDMAGTYHTSDVVRTIDSITVRTVLDAIYVAATVSTLSRQQITITAQAVA